MFWTIVYCLKNVRKYSFFIFSLWYVYFIEEKMEILKAEISDLEEVMNLHKRYHINTISEEDKPDGFVTASFTPEQLYSLVKDECGITIAKDNNKIIGYAMAASWHFWSEWPLLKYMIGKLNENIYNGISLGVDNSYQYGPVSVDRQYRGKGVFQKLFYASLESMASRYPIMITFINQINHRSYAAHTKKVKMDNVCTFQFNQNNYYMMACSTKWSYAQYNIELTGKY